MSSGKKSSAAMASFRKLSAVSLALDMPKILGYVGLLNSASEP